MENSGSAQRRRDSPTPGHASPDRILYLQSIAQILEAHSSVSCLVALDNHLAHYAWPTGTLLIQLFTSTTSPLHSASPEDRRLLQHHTLCAPAPKPPARNAATLARKESMSRPSPAPWMNS